MQVLIPSALLSYTHANKVNATGTTLSELLSDLDHQYPGLRFRIIDEQENIRPHIRCFVNGEQVFNLEQAIQSDDEVCLVQALSGG